MADLPSWWVRQQNAAAVEELCRSFGAAFVIDSAKAFVERKEREAAREHAKWRDEMVKMAQRASTKESGNA